MDRLAKDRIQVRGTTTGISHSSSAPVDMFSAAATAGLAAAAECAAARCTIGRTRPAMKHKYLRKVRGTNRSRAVNDG